MIEVERRQQLSAAWLQAALLELYVPADAPRAVGVRLQEGAHALLLRGLGKLVEVGWPAGLHMRSLSNDRGRGLRIDCMYCARARARARGDLCRPPAAPPPRRHEDFHQASTQPLRASQLSGLHRARSRIPPTTGPPSSSSVAARGAGAAAAGQPPSGADRMRSALRKHNSAPTFFP